MKLDIQSTRNRSIIDFRKHHYGNLCVLGRYHYQKAEKDLEWHQHKDMIELCYCDKGSQVFAVNKEKYLVKGGDVFIHYPNELHGSGGYPEAKGSLYWFIIRTKTVNGKKSRSDRDLDYLVQQLINSRKRHFRGGTAIRKLLEEIFAVMQHKQLPEPMRYIRVKLLTQLLLLKALEKSSGSEREPDNTKLNNVYRLIEANLTGDISVAMLAREANFSVSRFKSWFKELSGFTPLDYVQRCRVQQAVKVLQRDPAITYKDLAYELNFSSQQYFSTVVKKFTGKTPGEIRAQTIETQ